jgi:chemotaxis protein MotB
MARKKKHEKEPNHERWLVSYADFITLLFAVFVTLYAMSQTDKKKVEQVMSSMRESFGLAEKVSMGAKPSIVEMGDLRIMPSLKPESMKPGQKMRGVDGKKGRGQAQEKDFKEIKTSIEAFLIKSGAQEKVSVEINQRGLVVSLKEAGFFDSGSAAVRSGSLALLAQLVESLSNYENQYRVEGHTDNLPIKTAAFHSNWELSTARATTIVHYMINNYQFSPETISATGYGEHRPVADNGTAEGRGKNRRVDIVMLSADGARGEP